MIMKRYSASAMTEHIIPVDISNENFNKVNSIAMKAHNH